MSIAVRVSGGYSIGGKTFQQSKSLAADVGIPIEIEVPAAKAGNLTTRTDNDTGELTMGAAHGIATGNRLDLYWTEGGVLKHRRGMTVGTVAGNAVPIDGGAGDNLPPDESAIIAAVPVSQDVVVVGNNVVAFALLAPARAIFVIASAADAELYAVHHPVASRASGWDKENGVTNPLAGVTVGKVFLSHADTTAAKTLAVGFAYN
jgi:hypothetical protein